MASNPSLRDRAIASLGAARVIEAENEITQAIERLLAAPRLKKAGFRFRAGPKVVLRWSRGKSHGGIRGVRFALLFHAGKPDFGATYKEYKRLNDFSGIGDFTGSRLECYRILAAHELAHWLQYEPTVKKPEGRYRPPHGDGFRMIYRLLREELLSWEGICG